MDSGISGMSSLPHSPLAPVAQHAEGAPSPAPSDAPPDPMTQYLVLLEQGHLPDYARTHCGLDSEDSNPQSFQRLLGIARKDLEWAALESVYVGHSIRGARPAIAKALLAHETVGSVQALVRIRDTAPYARDQAHAAVALLDHGPLAPAQSHGASISITASQVSMMILHATPEQLAAIIAEGRKQS